MGRKGNKSNIYYITYILTRCKSTKKNIKHMTTERQKQINLHRIVQIRETLLAELHTLERELKKMDISSQERYECMQDDTHPSYNICNAYSHLLESTYYLRLHTEK